MIRRWNGLARKDVLPGIQEPLCQLLAKLFFLVAWPRLKAPLTRKRRVSFPDMELADWLLADDSRHLIGLLQQ
jgi:hypothetical protein